MPALLDTKRFDHPAFTFACIAVACVGSWYFFQFALGQYAMSRFWEGWVTKHYILAMLGPLALIALGAGLVVGLFIGALAGRRSLFIAASAGLLLCALHVSTALMVGGIAFTMSSAILVAPPSIAVGLVLGALIARRKQHA